MQRSLWLIGFLVFFLIACEQQKPEPQPATETQAQAQAQAVAPAPVADAAAGKSVAQQHCTACHGEDGATSKNGAPFIAGQQMQYMVSALQNYKGEIRKDKESHAALEPLSESDLRNAAAYYTGLSTQWQPERYKGKPASTAAVSTKHIEAGQKKAASCIDCHGKEGNSVIAEIPTLAGLQNDYIKTAIKAYFNGERFETKVIMQNFKHAVNKQDIEHLAAYFSTRKTEKSPLDTEGSVANGKKIATQKCAGCHGVDGNSISPTMPNLTGQNQAYLIKAVKTYRDGKRKNSMMQTAVSGLKDNQIRDITAYFAAQQPKKVVGEEAANGGAFDPLGDGQKIAMSCNGCHGENGNSTNSGIPSLARLHPTYFTAAVKSYQQGTRKNQTMQSLVSLLSDLDIEKVSLYYATQEPKASANAKPGNVEQGAEIAASCNGCHGENGNSTDPEVPSIAGQDAKYIQSAVKAYASGARENETMAGAVKELNDEQIKNVSAFYAGQAPSKLENINMPRPPEVVAEQCNHCHGENGYSTDPEKPRLAGQISAYLEKALNDYRSGTRESTAMHSMSAVLLLTEEKAITAYYSNK